MSETQRSDLQQYVKFHLEPGGLWDNDTLLEKPLADIVYKDSGEVTLKAGNIRINYSYEQVDATTTPSHIRAVLETYSGPWRRLRLFTLENTANGKSLAVLQLLLSDHHAIFNLVENIRNGNSTSDSNNKVVLMQSNLQRPYSSISLLHEIGHIVDGQTNPMDKEEEDARSLMQEHIPIENLSAKAKILRRERNAWAFAIERLKPLLEGEDSQSIFNKKRILDNVHHYNLGIYSYFLLIKRAAR